MSQKTNKQKKKCFSQYFMMRHKRLAGFCQMCAIYSWHKCT